MGESVMTKFIGRKRQLQGLTQLRKNPGASLAVLRGRRRIGKTRLAEEFSHAYDKKYFFAGLAPQAGITDVDQRKEFLRQMYEQKIPCYPSDDWGDLFTQLANHCHLGETLIVFDEITWMCLNDPTFLPKLKNAWDYQFKKNDDLIFIISGSNSAWIKRNILSSTGFFGRISYRNNLDELSLHQCNQFWGKAKDKISSFEKLKVLAVTGGIPRYLEEIQPNLTAEQNILRLCYQPEGLLFNEFDDLFKDLFARRDERYKDIIKALVDGNTNIDSIAEALNRKKGGDLSSALEELAEDGFITRLYSWNIKSGKQLENTSRFFVKDNYFRFYIKYILPFKHRIEMGEMDELPPGWEGILGLQFEHLLINNRKSLHRILHIPANEIVFSNPYLQRETKLHKGCQIDYMVQTKFNVLYICEIKFSKRELSPDVITEVKQKIAQLQIPRGFSLRPVLVHVNGVSDELVARDYFANIIDFAELL